MSFQVFEIDHPSKSEICMEFITYISSLVGGAEENHVICYTIWHQIFEPHNSGGFHGFAFNRENEDRIFIIIMCAHTHLICVCNDLTCKLACYDSCSRSFMLPLTLVIFTDH